MGTYNKMSLYGPIERGRGIIYVNKDSMDAFIDIVLQQIRREFHRPEPRWTLRHRWTDIPAEKRTWMENECNRDSEFDALGLRKSLMKRMKEKKTPVTYATCPYGEVIVGHDETRDEDIPWGLWGRILRLFSSKRNSKPRFTVYFLAHASRRTFPSLPSTILPQHINGGYTYPCQADTIVLYRAEDATRVLIHELQHACCLDHHENGLDHVEADTEAWAELFYVALLSKGQPKAWNEGGRRQWNWMVAQNHRVRQHLTHPMEFPWRYTVGKQERWERWFFRGTAPPANPAEATDSLRLTAPPTAEQKRAFGVRPSSVVL